MLHRFGIENTAVRQMLNEYLLERAPSLDHATLRGLAATLGRLFWRDLEIHHPGISSLNLAPDVAAAWKQRILLRITRVTDPDGQVVETRALRFNGRAELRQVRAFYLDIAQWAMEEPARWGPWAAPSPVRPQDLARMKEIRQRKSRIDQRTRERLPALPALVAQVQARARACADRLTAATAVDPGDEFTCHGEVLHRAPVRSGPNKVWSWDITKLKGPTRGVYYDAYVIIDIYSRKIPHWEIHVTEKESSPATSSRTPSPRTAGPCQTRSTPITGPR